MNQYLQEDLVKLCIYVTRILFFWVPGDVAKGQALMIFHTMLHALVIVLFFLSEANSFTRFFIAFIVAVVSASQLLFKGCVVTHAETRLTGSKKTTVDQLFLKLAGICITDDTLSAVTIASGSKLAIVFVIAILCDFK